MSAITGPLHVNLVLVNINETSMKCKQKLV